MTSGIASPVIEDLLTRLEKVKSVGRGQWVARCPAHEDRDPSLSIGEGADGRALLTCHAGCSPESIVHALGLELRDLFPESDRRPGPNGSELVAAYDYLDESGTLLFQVCRFHPKTFRQRAPDGSGWRWKVAGVRRVLYRLPDVRKAAEEGRIVFVTEGERDADRLAALEFTATTNPGGAGKWRDDYTDQLAGTLPVILPDNDDPGRDHAATVARKLRAAGLPVRVVHLPGLPAKGDVCDWLDAGGTADRLRGLVKEAEEWDGEDPEDDDALPQAVSLANLPDAEPIEWFQKGCIPAREPVLIVADGGAGKTTFLLATLGAAAAGANAHGRSGWELEHGPVLFVSEEDPEAVIENRVDALADGMGWDRELVRSRFHVLALKGVQLDRPEWRTHLLAEVERLGVVAVGLDPYSDLTAAAENDNDETKPFKRLLRDIAKLGATPIVSHHLGKKVEGKRKQDRIRGASALDHASRCTMYLSNDDAGIKVEWLKLSRAKPPRSFVLHREIETEPRNVGVWKRARLTYMTEAAAEEDVAEDFIRGELARTPGLNSTELRECAKGSGVSGAALSAAQRRMENRGEIEYEPGKRNAKHWHLTTLPDDSRQGGQGTLPSLPDPARQGEGAPDDPAYPYKGAGSGEGSDLPGRQGDETEAEPDDLITEMEDAA